MEELAELFTQWDGDMLDAVPEIAEALSIPRSRARKMVAQGEVGGTCSKCGEARFSSYTCRDGGATVWSVRPSVSGSPDKAAPSDRRPE